MYTLYYFISVARRVADQNSHKLEEHELQLELYNPDLGTPPSADEDSKVTSSTERDPQSSIPSAHAAAASCSAPSTTGVDGDAAPSGGRCQVADASGSTSSMETAAGSTGEHLYPDLEIVQQQMQGVTLGEKKPQKIQREVGGLHHVYVSVLDAFSDMISDKFSGVQVTTSDTSVKIEGEKHDVETVDKLVSFLSWKQKSSKYIAEVADKFCGWEDIFSDIEEDVNKGNYFLILREGQFDGCIQEELCIRLSYDDRSGSSNVPPMSLDQFLQRYVSKKEVFVKSEAAVNLLSTTAWEEFIGDRYGRGIHVFPNHHDCKKILVLGSVKDLEDACYYVEQFLQNMPDQRSMHLYSKEIEFLTSCCQNILASLQFGTGSDNAVISIEGNVVKIKGCRVGVAQAEKELKKIRKKFRCARAIFFHPGLASLLHSQREVLDQMIEHVSAEYQCIITDLPDLQIADTDEDCGDWGQWSATVLHSYTFWGQRLQCHVVEGKGEDLRVDAVILCHDGKGTPPSQQHRPLSMPPSSMLPSTQGAGM